MTGTLTERPPQVTSTRVPHGSVRWATPIVVLRRRTPQAVRLPGMLYQVAVAPR